MCKKANKWVCTYLKDILPVIRDMDNSPACAPLSHANKTPHPFQSTLFAKSPLDSPQI